MLRSTAAPALRRAAPALRRAAPALLACRGLATGPASGGAVSDEMLEKLGTLSTQDAA